MRTLTHYATLDEREETLTVTYGINGKYRGATHWEPAEEPELEIESVVNEEGEDWYDIMYANKREADRMEEACWSHANELCMDAQMSRAEARLEDKMLREQEA